MADKIINGVEYYRLLSRCPVCFERGNETAPSYWYHELDDGDIYVGCDAKYYCDACKKNSHVMNWVYKCPNHSGSDDDYVEVGVSTPTMAEIMGPAILMIKSVGLPWVREFLKNLEY